MHDDEIKVWDPLVRLFHWLLVAGFFIAYLSGDEWLTVHVWAGYLVAGLILFRLLWGFVGPRHARFSDFVVAPAQVRAYLTDMLKGRERRYLGHNPAGGLMIVALLLGLAAISLTGLALYGVEDQAGPLAGLMAGSGEFTEDVLEELHEFFANLTLLLVAIHVAGVVWESLRHGENLVRAMITGRKRAPRADA